jgi:UDP-N-acetylglucosamine acyltransferase
MLIHRTAIVHPEARLEPGVEVGAYSVIGKNVTIEAGTKIGSHVVIDSNSRIGPDCKVFSHAVIGSDPQDLKYRGAESWVEIGAGTIIREFVTINRGSKEGAVTRVGNGTLLMTGVHVAHDCQVGNNVIMVNLATLGGFCEVEDCAVIGGLAVAHQFVRVGKMTMVGGTAGLLQDAPPYMMVFGTAPARVVNINTVGLRRNGVSSEVRAHLRHAFKVLYRSGLTTNQALEEIERTIPPGEEVRHLLEFFRNSSRGTCTAVRPIAVGDSSAPSVGNPFYDELTAGIPAT